MSLASLLASFPLAVLGRGRDARIGSSSLASLVETNRQERGREEMLGFCPAELRALLARSSFVTASTATALVSRLPQPTESHAPSGSVVPSSITGVLDWQVRRYDWWPSLLSDLVEVPIPASGSGFLHLGRNVPVFLVDLRRLGPLMGQLSQYLDASGCRDFAVASASLDAGLRVVSQVGYQPRAERILEGDDEMVYRLCTWSSSPTFPQQAKSWG